jgi:hypothetical protein
MWVYQLAYFAQNGLFHSTPMIPYYKSNYRESASLLWLHHIIQLIDYCHDSIAISLDCWHREVEDFKGDFVLLDHFLIVVFTLLISFAYTGHVVYSIVDDVIQSSTS